MELIILYCLTKNYRPTITAYTFCVKGDHRLYRLNTDHIVIAQHFLFFFYLFFFFTHLMTLLGASSMFYDFVNALV